MESLNTTFFEHIGIMMMMGRLLEAFKSLTLKRKKGHQKVTDQRNRNVHDSMRFDGSSLVSAACD